MTTNTNTATVELASVADGEGKLKRKDLMKFKRAVAVTRNSDWRSLSLEDQLEVVKGRPGNARRQIDRIKRHIQARDIYTKFGKRLIETTAELKRDESVTRKVRSIEFAFDVNDGEASACMSELQDLYSVERILIRRKGSKFNITIADNALAEHIALRGIKPARS